MHSLLEETAPRRAFLALQALRRNKAAPSPDVAAHAEMKHRNIQCLLGANLTQP